MNKRWDKYTQAIENLKQKKKEKAREGKTSLRRYEAEASDVLDMSSGVFEKFVRTSQLFRAFYKPYTDGRSSSYEIDDLIAHIERMQSDAEIAKLHYYHYCKPEEFNEHYPNDYDYVFAEGTYSPVLGGVVE